MISGKMKTGLIKKTDTIYLTKEQKKDISISVDRLMRIKRIRIIKKLKKWLKCHTN